MAEKRMISKVISVSEKVNIKLKDSFHMLLYTWMIPHTDDFGRLTGSPAKVRALIVPMLDYTISDVEKALQAMYEAELINWYEVNGDKYIEIINFEVHQSGLQRRTPSKIPGPLNSRDHPKRHLTSNNEYLSASESDIEELVILKLEENQFIEGDEIISTERQLRVGNSYLDILATGKSGKRYLFELKRQRLSNSAIEQIVKYQEMLNDKSVQMILIGYGLASNFDLSFCKENKINVLVYNDKLDVDIIMSFDVKYRQLTSLTNRTELKGTEQKEKRIEEKGKEEKVNATLSSDPSEKLKDEIHQLAITCKIENLTLHGLDELFSYVGLVDKEIIEAAVKKSEGKHVNYALKILKGMYKEGITKKEQLFEKPAQGKLNIRKDTLPTYENEKTVELTEEQEKARDESIKQKLIALGEWDDEE